MYDFISINITCGNIQAVLHVLAFCHVLNVKFQTQHCTAYMVWIHTYKYVIRLNRDRGFKT
jgi:hypothetical protein